MDKIKINRLLLTFLIPFISSCGFFELINPGYHVFEIENKTDSDINIYAYEKSKLIEQINIKKRSSLIRFNEQRGFGNNPSIFPSILIDSIVVINEQQLGFIQFCNHNLLIDNSDSKCRNIDKNLMNIYINGSVENFEKKLDGHKIIAKYFMSFEPTNFVNSLE